MTILEPPKNFEARALKASLSIFRGRMKWGERGLEGNIPLLACRIYHLTLVIAVLRTKRGHVCRVVASRQTNVLGGFNTFGHHQAAEGCPW